MQLLQCDRCKKTESGFIRDGVSGGVSSIAGWETVRVGGWTECLLCKDCVPKLKAWLRGDANATVTVAKANLG